MPTRLKLKDGEFVTLRPATNADSEEARRLIFEVLAEYGLQGEPDVTDACVKDIEANYFRDGGLFNVILDDTGRLVGCYGLLPHPATELGRSCELRKMYFRREIRGRGLGRQIMVRALDEARRLGFTRVELDTASPLHEAVHLYESFGFKDFHNPNMPKRCDRAMALELRHPEP